MEARTSSAVNWWISLGLAAMLTATAGCGMDSNEAMKRLDYNKNGVIEDKEPALLIHFAPDQQFVIDIREQLKNERTVGGLPVPKAINDEMLKHAKEANVMIQNYYADPPLFVDYDMAYFFVKENAELIYEKQDGPKQLRIVIANWYRKSIALCVYGEDYADAGLGMQAALKEVGKLYDMEFVIYKIKHGERLKDAGFHMKDPR